MARSSAPPRLANQRVLVTGAGRGIGRAIALACAEEGARVAIVSRTRSELEETLALASRSDANGDGGGECGDATTMSLHVADVTDETQVEDAVASVVEQWGGIDVLVNNAGSSQGAKALLWELGADGLRSLLDLNVVGVHAVTSAVLRRAMLPAGRGKIVNIR